METFNVYLLLVVVAILGTSGENIAIGKPTQQSHIIYSGVSSRAVDGNTNSNYGLNSCTHTSSGPYEWWCVDLQAVYNNISYILLYNRDSDKERLQGFKLKTSRNGECNGAGFTSATTCYIDKSSSVEDIYTVDTCNQQSSSLPDTKVIFISVNNYKPVTLCEVEVLTDCSNCKDDGCENRECTNGCMSGFIGPRCLPCNYNCNNGCDQQNGKCNSCKEGRYGDQCDMTCNYNCNNGCDQTTGRCNSCRVGLYGDQCDKPCNNNCYNGCDRSTGKCNSCNKGWHGDQCNTPCNNNCNNGCNQQNGKCIDGCKGKFYGDKCEMECNNCQISCQQSDGVCNNGGCVDGYWGAKCLTSCPSNCVRRQCGKGDGRCTSCPDGKYGSYCKQTCNNGCIDKDCDRYDGRCSKGCTRGRYSDHCDTDCTVTNCVGNCDRTSGQCKTCTTGWYGNNCESRCSSKCSSGCDKSTGRCDDCIEGRFGDGCNKVCPPNCVGGCNRIDGKCKLCKPDTVGDNCEPVSDKPTPNINGRFTECIDGEYSDKCEKNCSESCKYVCQRNDGTCTVAGINKKMIENCSISPAVYTITGFIVGVVVTLIVGVLIYIFYIKRRMIKKQSTGTESVIYNNRSDTDGNINTTYDTLDQVLRDNRDTTYISLDNRESQHEYYNQESRLENQMDKKDNQYYNINKQ